MMDLDEVDLDSGSDGEGAPAPAAAPPPVHLAVDAALAQFDRRWYGEINRKSRWMDLIGDYAGNERFIVDGESLLQTVLDDTLLSIGRSQDPSFQFLHAQHSMETILENLIKRSAVFDVVFWEDNRHCTVHTGAGEYEAASRSLARRMLYRHLFELSVSVYTFASTSDSEWNQYFKEKRPMFVMANDGGLLRRGQHLDAERILLQRTFIFNILTSGLAIALLSNLEFRDTKILAFVLEQRRERDASKRFPAAVWVANARAKASLDDFESPFRIGESLPLAKPLSDLPPSLDDCLTNTCRRYITATEGSRDRFALTFLRGFVAHMLLVPTVAIENRVQPLVTLNDTMRGSLINSFLPKVFRCLESVAAETGWRVDIDGRLFVHLLRVLWQHTDAPLAEVVGEDVASRTESIWSSLGADPADIPALALSSPFPQDAPAPASSSRVLCVLPFDNDVLNAQLASVHVVVEPRADTDAAAAARRGQLNFGAGTVFEDRRHWHNARALLPKHLGGADARPADARARNRQLRREQKFMAALHKQAATLTGALGARFNQRVIAPVGRSKAANAKPLKAAPPKVQPPKAQPPKTQKKKTEPKLSAADKIRQENQKKKQAKEDTVSSSWWRERLEELNKIDTPRKRASKTEDLFRNAKCAEGWLAVEVRLYRLHVELLSWIEEAKKEDADVRDAFTVAIMRMVKGLYDRKHLWKTAAQCLKSVLDALGFSSYVDALSKLAVDDDAPDRALNFEFVKLVKKKSGSVYSPIYKYMPITEHPISWQLRLFGEYMDRSMDSQPDSRVDFEPDGWQREVLDCLDDNKSVLVVAPTSAGKTFISFYAMEKTLRESDDGVLVYIAPTKALVNQVAAEISARFKKDMSGRSCWAVHTRDHRINDPQKCQILVTVPEMFAIMLLSPPLVKTWTPKLKRIILDEVHSIGQQEGGAVWEQILLLAPCPIIGLSATIGHPEVFNSWLETVQKAHGFDHTFIHHPHRYSHLRKYMYVIPPHYDQFSGLHVHANTSDSRVRQLHPISMLAFGTPTLPPDFSLEARDTLTLYNAMVDAKVDADLPALDPVHFFRDPKLLRQKDVLSYEASLKDVLGKMIASPDNTEDEAPLQKVIRSLQDHVLAKMPESDLNTAPEPHRFLSGIIALLADLHVSNDLPALLFSFDRYHCELMAKVVLKAMVSAEAEWREHSPEWQKKIAEWKVWKERVLQYQRQAEKAQKQKTKAEDAALDLQEASGENSFDPTEPSSHFSFAGTHRYSKNDLREDLRKLKWTSTPQWAVDALRRGVGVHHSGMNKSYRVLVESLFRLGYLRVVFATGTLALGINAPTKTSVFCGDSPYLTALMYRQCAGRAGRRGHDLLGKVVFYGLPMDKAQRLVLSKLPLLTGNFPISSTLCLRLFNLLHGSDNAKLVVDAVQSLLNLPQISFGSDTGREQLLHHFRFSIDYLRRAGLLDLNGRPMNLYGIAAHLYHTEPSNLALIALLRAGVIHDICNQSSTIQAKMDFVLLMCHLFGRRFLPKIYTTEANLREIKGRYPSQVVLPPLPQAARVALREHNEEILRVFSGYAHLYSTQYGAALGPDDTLPLSEMKITSASDGSSTTSYFHDSIQQSAIPVVTRSPFIANSGHSDDFASVDELTRTCRRGLNLNEHAIPSLQGIISSNDNANSPTLNAYLLDFFVHGQVKSLVHANGIRRGDVWYALQDFVLALMTIRTSIEQLLLKATEDAKEQDVEDDETEIDSGYVSADVESEEADGDSYNSPFKRPAKVSDRDWRVYEVVDTALREFDEKFRKMWA